MAHDNGEAGAEGQPPPWAFPKAFVTSLLQGLSKKGLAG
jgi:hypothetical protein